jgi:O-antigen/teichoic acid export membrane protein
MQDSQKSYREIFKATSIFGTVQVFNIIGSLIRSKFAAIFIGPIGVGILGVLNSTIGLITGISKIGLDTSSVKEIAYANKSNNKLEVEETIYTLRRLLWITGILGMVITISFSATLSEFAFGSKDFTVAFIWLSIVVLFNQLTIGNLAVLQGLRRLRQLALANLVASFASIVVIVPFYYYLELKGIVPSIITIAIITFLIASYYAKNLISKGYKQSMEATFKKGKSMIRLGAVLSINSLITLLVAYIMQVYITNAGGLVQVGLYNAGIVIINSYVGLVFKAMSKDYFPRLSETIDNPQMITQKMSQQSIVAILLLTPIVVVFIAFAPFIIHFIYSKEFLPVATFVSLGLLGTMFKAMSWAQGYVIIAKGDSRVFVKTAIGFNTVLLLFNIIGYSYYGLMGLGVSFVVYYIIHYILISFIMNWRYKIRLEKPVFSTFLKCIMFSVFTYICTFINMSWMKYGILVVLIIGVVGFSLYEFNKRIDIKTLFKQKQNND